MMSLNNSTNIPESFSSSDYNFQQFCDKKRERILIVDDEEIIRRFLVGCLEARFDCCEAASVEEAFEILAENQFSLVLTDWVMTGKSGTTLLRFVVSQFPDTPVIMITGVDNPERAIDAMRFGAFDYLLKPCKPDILEFTVERALEHRNLQIRNRQYKIDLELQNIELVKRKDRLEKLQMRMIYTEKMASLGQLCAGIAHEINNPLGYVSGNLQMLEEYLSETKKVKTHPKGRMSAANAEQMVQECLDGVRRITELVKHLRVFSNLDAPDFTESDINRDLQATVKLLDYFFDKTAIILTFDSSEIPPVEAAAGHLNQVWMNILLNAAQSLENKGGKITIKTGLAHDFVFVEITDTGEGIAPENLPRIFEPFFTTKPIGSGTGLGLSTAYGIIEAHQGAISVESELKKGTTVTVKLPVKKPKEQLQDR